LYFIEDLQVGRRSPWFDAANGLVMSDILQSWLDQLVGYFIYPNPTQLIVTAYVSMYACMKISNIIYLSLYAWQLSPQWKAYNSPGSQGHPDRASMQQRFPLPVGLKWIFCQYEACVLSKCHPDLSGGCAPPITFAEDKPLRP